MNGKFPTLGAAQKAPATMGKCHACGTLSHVHPRELRACPACGSTDRIPAFRDPCVIPIVNARPHRERL